MARRDQVTRHGAIEALQRYADEPDYVLVRTSLLVHERTTHGRPCGCCGSTTCAVTETLPDLELLIDTSEGQRYLRHEMFRRGPYRLRDHGGGGRSGRSPAPLHADHR